MSRFMLAGVLCVLGTFAVVHGQNSEGQNGSQAAQAGNETQEDAAAMHQHMKAMNEMMIKQLGGSDEHYEQRFIDMMIPHHEGAVLSARHALKHAKRPELKEMAQKMIKEQEKEIAQLKQWRRDWYGTEVDNTDKPTTEEGDSRGN